MAVCKINKIGLVTDDVEGAVQFYTQLLGLRVSERFANDGDDDYVFLQAGNIILELMPTKSAGSAPGFHHLSFAVEDIVAETQELREKGVPIRKNPFTVGIGGIRLTFFDGPNGLNLQLFERTATAS